MIGRNLYYQLKPYLPWRLRLKLRQVAVRQTRNAVGPNWYIDPAAGAPPAQWPGWPEGKRFALVLTHDVEGVKGLRQSRRLAELEIGEGFRSSFNFIPEGTYSASPELRAWLVSQGFEVGIHDLHHDGKLYRTRSAFRRSATRINHYVRQWQTVGFRSGFMLRELEWMHDLDIAYDSSTFDTDPFEPQPGPAGTIFPFFIPPPPDRPDRPGYVELPYTLPQDSTLFLFLREATPEIWMRKLDWVAQHGGMALVNVHPDYLRFEGDPASPRTFPVNHYRTFLQYARDRYGASAWQPLPGQLANWFKQGRRPASVPGPAFARGHRPAAAYSPPAALRGKRAAVLLYSYYPSDSRPRRAAEAMVEAGMEVDLLCLSEGKDEPRRSMIDGVRVFRFPIRHSRSSKFIYLWNYSSFLLSSFSFLTWQGLRRGYDVVHVHNMPDALVFATLREKWRGARILLDLHDPMPELMMSIYGKPAGHWSIRLLKFLERRSIAFADAVLTPNVTFCNLFAARNRKPEKISIVMNSPEEEIFDPSQFPAKAPLTEQRRGEFHVMHHGSIVHRHGIDLLIEAVAVVRPQLPGIRLDIYGRREPFLDTVLALAQERGIADLVQFHGNKTAWEIGQAILDTDLGVIPNRRSAFTDINFPTRIFEYLALERLVIAPATQGITDYFGPDDLPMYEQDNVAALAHRILWAQGQPAAAQQMLARGRAIFHRHRWSQEKARFLNLVAGSAA